MDDLDERDGGSRGRSAGGFVTGISDSILQIGDEPKFRDGPKFWFCLDRARDLRDGESVERSRPRQ